MARLGAKGDDTHPGSDYRRRPWCAPIAIVHNDLEPGREHDASAGLCWCDPEIVSCHTEARA